MVENSGRKGGTQGTNGLCVVTKMSAWKTVGCESAERRRGGGLSDHFLVEARLKLLGGWRSARRMEGVRNVLKEKVLKKVHTRRACVENMKCGEVGRSRVRTKRKNF